MLKTLLLTAIEQRNSFMTPDMIRLQVEFFHTAGKLSDEEKEEILSRLAVPEAPVEESEELEQTPE